MDKKICNTCGKEFPATPDYFYKNKKSKYGILGKCKKCCKIYNKNYYINNRIKECKRQYNFRKENPRYANEYRKLNKKRIREYRKGWKDRNPNYFRVWRSKNIDRERNRKANIEAARRVKIKNQTPKLNDAEKTKAQLYYDISGYLGSDWQVDHIIPLSKGGLHHPDNLQIVTASYNFSKGNKLNYRKPKILEVWGM